MRIALPVFLACLIASLAGAASSPAMIGPRPSLVQSAPAPQPRHDPIDPAKVNRWIDGRLGPEGTAGRLGPAVIVVIDRGKIIAQRTYGLEDLKTKRPVRFDQSMFRL